MTSTQDYDRLGRKAVFLVLLYFFDAFEAISLFSVDSLFGLYEEKKWGNVIVK